MSKRHFPVLVLVLSLGLAGAGHAQEKKRNLLVVGQSKGYQHDSVSTAMVTLYNLGRSSKRWDTYFRTDCAAITKKPLKYGAKNLDAFDAVVFFTDGDLDMDASQKADLLSFVRDDGKGFIGIHSAAITFVSWPEYGKMIGGYFDGHPWGEFDAPLVVEDGSFPGMGHFPRNFSLKDEIYQIKDFSRDNVRVLLRLDASKVDVSRKGVHRQDEDFAVIWARNYGKGRVLYNGLGHRRDVWDRPDIQQMWLEMVKWSMGIIPGDATPRPAPAVAGGDFPKPPDTEKSSTRPLPPDKAAAGFRAPAGFRVNVFAAEPDVQNPVAMAWDTRGRLWVAENYTYSDITEKLDLRLRDRVVIFEDTDADGRMDKRTIFTDQVQRLGSVELGFGGVWLMCPPQLLFFPDRDGDYVPDGPAEVLLDGFTVATENHHTFANGLRWGPDGWLYGRCGASSPGQIGAPGTPDADRIPIRGGLWRYHPVHKRFEVLCHGTTNPWGHDWNALGEAFFINTVNGHLWHVIPGAHFVRPHSIEPNPRAYAIIDQHADHYHWDNSIEYKKFLIPGSIDDRRGGGHAHSGVMIYLGDQWPETYRDKLFTLNFHGRRVNVERLERNGSGYVGRHEPDILFAADPWFRGIDLSYGPDGSVFVIDWSDTGECHEHDGVHRSSGRIYRITYGEPARTDVRDVSKLAEHDLIALHRHANEWFVRKARRVLAERSTRGERLDDAKAALHTLFEKDPDPSRKIRALCSLYVIGGTDTRFLRGLLRHEHESVRAWAIRLLTDTLPIDTIDSVRGGPDVELPAELRSELAALAKSDPSGLVRLVLASTLQRLPAGQRVPLAQALVSRSEDNADHNIPPLIWTGLIPVALADPAALVRLAIDCRLPNVLRLIARRLGEDIETHPGPLDALLEAAARRPEGFQAQVVAGLSDALTGWRKAKKPAAWDRLQDKLSTATDSTLRDRARDLNVVFGDGRALEEVKRLALDESASLDVRKAALRTLIETRPPDLRAVCERLVRVRFLNSVAVRGLALFDDPAIGGMLAQSYRAFHPSERSVLLETLTSRRAFARALLDQISTGKIPRQDLTAFHARQIRSLGDPALTERLAQVWGVQRDSAADRREQITALKKQLAAAVLARADRGRGRALFDRVCASCHKLYGYGGEIGPDLTGGGRDNLDYLLENLVDPSASVNADFRMVVVAMNDGRVLNGLVRARTDRTLTLQTQTEALVLDRRAIDSVQPSPLSLMPDGLLAPLSETETRDLLSYLMCRTQVPLPRPER